MKVTENVFMLDCTEGSHVYFIGSEAGILIDTGMPHLAKRILAELAALGAGEGTVRTILLTHHDVDHMGSAKALQEATGAALWAAREDIPYITGEKGRPGVKRVFSALLRPQKPTVSGSFDSGALFGETKPLHTPGHTPGHTIFQYRDVLFTGDLFQTRGGRFSLLPPHMNWDEQAVKNSVALLKKMEFAWLCPAHGRPVQNGPAVQEFLHRF